MLPVLAALALLADAGCASAVAQGRLEAQYSVTVAGIPIGKGNWVIDIADDHYSAALSGATTGLVRAFTGGQGASATQGTLQAGKPFSSVYAASITTRKKTDAVHLTFIGGKVTDFKIEPPEGQNKDRVPVTEESRRGVLDPMSAMLLRTPGAGNPLTPEACQRTLAVFDGKLRYDLQFAFKRMDKVKADKGYAGPVVVCAVYFTPVAGYVPSAATIRYLSRLRDMEIWLAPIAGTRMLVPFRAQSPTPIGTAVLEADRFVSVAAPIKESAKEPSKPAPKAASKLQADGAKAQ
jgi:hypothetical protein